MGLRGLETQGKWGTTRQMKRHSLGNVEHWRWVDEKQKQTAMVMWSRGRLPHPYIPIEVTRDKECKWVSARWLSKQMSYSCYKKKRATEIGLSIIVRLGSRGGNYMQLDQAVGCILVESKRIKEAFLRAFCHVHLEMLHCKDSQCGCKAVVVLLYVPLLNGRRQ